MISAFRPPCIVHFNLAVPELRYEPLHAFFTTAVALRRIRVHATPWMFRPPKSPLAAVLQHQALALSVIVRCRTRLVRSGSGDRFRRSRGFPGRRASASRLPDAGTSLRYSAFSRSRLCSSATCSGLHATPRSSGLSERPPAAFHQHRAPIAVDYSRLIVRRSLRVAPEPFQPQARRRFRRSLSGRFPRRRLSGLATACGLPMGLPVPLRLTG
jgi:hypothetical protein